VSVDLLEFGAYIKDLRKNKKLTIRQLEEKTGVSNAYLSQIENGKKKSLPSPEILMKIHEPLGVAYDELMEKAGYISSETRAELLPETIQTMESYKDLVELVENASEMFINAMFADSKTFKELLVKEAKATYSDISGEELDEVINNPEAMFEHLTLEEKISFLNGVIKDFVNQGIDPKEIFKSNSQNINENCHPVLYVPVLGYIAAGQPILTDEHIEEWTELPNMWNLKEKEAIVLKVKGDSMIGSRIYEGDKVVVKLQPEVENGEIAVVNINGDEATLKRVKKTENGQVILYPDNPNYEPIFITNEKARIIGKVVQVMFEPK
jgi:SOS regulatory protein LexA